jgi:dCMP deaminase
MKKTARTIIKEKPILKTTKREGYLSWDEYFMGVALLSAERSKDPNTQLGACIVSLQKKIMGVGYNGFPIGCSDDELPWSREGDLVNTKYPYVCHAELNAIMNSRDTNLDGCTIYIGLFPCNECTKLIIQSGIKEVVYLSDKYAHLDAYKASKRMLEMAGVKTRQLVMPQKNILLSFRIPEWNDRGK